MARINSRVARGEDCGGGVVLCRRGHSCLSRSRERLRGVPDLTVSASPPPPPPGAFEPLTNGEPGGLPAGTRRPKLTFSREPFCPSRGGDDVLCCVVSVMCNCCFCPLASGLRGALGCAVRGHASLHSRESRKGETEVENFGTFRLTTAWFRKMPFGISLGAFRVR